uniref:Uncharacterized protein n=1 Tax=Amphimedon queenslandica TaxID=400682 RepID=A0A1X7SU62_AMPQE
MKRSIVNESPSQRESRLNNERLRSKQRCVNESEAQRVARLDDQRQRSQRANESELEQEVRLLDLRQSDRERRDSETEEQRAQRNDKVWQYSEELSANQTCPLPLQKAYVSNNCHKNTSKNFKKKYDYLQPVYAVNVNVCATQNVYHWL